MGNIRILPDHLANQIAAGEVVERPASALKELLENSLDAGADHISVVLENGGKRRIQVEDNGRGMDRDDCLMALERHATSKLSRAEDLFSINTLGFRGEALPSIASVSRMTLESRTASMEAGVQVRLTGAKLNEVKEISRNVGTKVSVETLFFNIPARKKFLRKTETELGWMVNLVTQYSMKHPDIHFHLEHNGRILIDVSPVASLRERIYQHFGKVMLDDLIPFEAEHGWLRLKGLTATPGLCKSSRNFQYLFVNGRLVKDKVLNHAISEVYEDFSEQRIYPVIFLFLEMPSAEVDVNVHPAKTQVKFINGNFVHDRVRDTLREAVVSRRFAPEYRFREGYHEHPTPPRRDPWRREQQQQLPNVPQGPLFDQGDRKPGAGGAGQSPGPAAAPADSVNPPARTEAKPASPTQPDSPYAKFRRESADLFSPRAGSDDGALEFGAGPPAPPASLVEALPPQIIGQFRDSYILAEHDGDLLLIDQHIAHERILYDRIVREVASQEIERQALLVPVTVELTPAQAVEMNRLLPEIRRFGFDLEAYGGHTFIIREIPTFAKNVDLAIMVAQLADRAQGDRRDILIDTMHEHAASSKSCHAAIKVNMRLTTEKMRYLVEELWKSKTPLFCPHGRPIVLRFNNQEIEKNFHRQ